MFAHAPAAASVGALWHRPRERAAGAGASLCQLHLQAYEPIAPLNSADHPRPRTGEESLLCLVPPAPRLPGRIPDTRRAGLASLAIHGLAAVLLVLATSHAFVGREEQEPAAARGPIDLPRMVFLLTPEPGGGGGGGGGGKRQKEPPSRAQAIGHDALTLHVAHAARPTGRLTNTPASEPAPLLQARTLSSGLESLLGLPAAPEGLAVSGGSGTGGGIGTGTGTGLGTGLGPGIGPGSGGGFGGGAYRLGTGVEAPRLLREVKPTYTAEALMRRIEGSVILEVVVGADGVPAAVRVTRSLDPYGLDEEAIQAARGWRFVPGRFNGTPVAVLVTLVLDFHIR